MFSSFRPFQRANMAAHHLSTDRDPKQNKVCSDYTMALSSLESASKFSPNEYTDTLLTPRPNVKRIPENGGENVCQNIGVKRERKAFTIRKELGGFTAFSLCQVEIMLSLKSRIFLNFLLKLRETTLF